jgi:hypothetical protein
MIWAWQAEEAAEPFRFFRVIAGSGVSWLSTGKSISIPQMQ